QILEKGNGLLSGGCHIGGLVGELHVLQQELQFIQRSGTLHEVDIVDAAILNTLQEFLDFRRFCQALLSKQVCPLFDEVGDDQSSLAVCNFREAYEQNLALEYFFNPCGRVVFRAAGSKALSKTLVRGQITECVVDIGYE